MEGVRMKRFGLLLVAFAVALTACGGDTTPETVIREVEVEVPGETITETVTETIEVEKEAISFWTTETQTARVEITQGIILGAFTRPIPNDGAGFPRSRRGRALPSAERRRACQKTGATTHALWCYFNPSFRPQRSGEPESMVPTDANLGHGSPLSRGRRP